MGTLPPLRCSRGCADPISAWSDSDGNKVHDPWRFGLDSGGDLRKTLTPAACPKKLSKRQTDGLGAIGSRPVTRQLYLNGSRY